MTIKAFLNELKSQLNKTNPKTKVGGYTYFGLNKKDSFGAPGGGDWSESPAFEFHKSELKYLIRIIPKYNKIVIELLHLSTMLINYTLDENNFIEENGKIKLLENYVMTVIHRRPNAEVKKAMIKSGMPNNVIFIQDVNKLNKNTIVDSLIKWASYREKAKEMIRNNKIDKKEINTSAVKTVNEPLGTLNQILYGPPGTGKTFKLLEYQETYFIDKGITKTSEEILKETVGKYPFWKILAAVLGTSKASKTVSEIIDHPIVKARVNIANKTKPRNLAWADLQSYADDESTQLESKYRRSIKLFHKGKESRWSIANDKKEDLADIIGQELLDIAADRIMQPDHSATSKKRFNFITFHQKYSYEDFIEGIKPLLKKDDLEVDEVSEEIGNLQFELKKGIFYKCCLEALELVGYRSFKECYDDSKENRSARFNAIKENPSKQFAIFIDEINRANISAVFGELITLLEDDKRMGTENEMWVELPYSNEKFSIPANMYVIGTMNTADRSIALLDIALRRRFEFKALYPLYIETEWWSALLTALNQSIYNWKKNPDFFIGHAFFIYRPEADKIKILNTKIIPLLYEYCQNNAETVKRILSEAGVQIKTTTIKENFQIIAE